MRPPAGLRQWLLAAAILAAPAIVVAGAGGVPAAAATQTATFTATGQYSIPAGTTSLQVTLVGAAGISAGDGASLPAAPGMGAEVTATIPPPSGVSTLYVEVGTGGGGSPYGGAGGGESALDVCAPGTAGCNDTADPATDPRLLVAGGGGGGCEDVLPGTGSGVWVGGAGGNAGNMAVTGPGSGGAGADEANGGQGGDGGLGGALPASPGPGSPSCGEGGSAGGPGVGGAAQSTLAGDSENGGGGGAGWIGGSGGGSGGCTSLNGAGGGGGAGSSFVEAAAINSTVSTAATATPEVIITPVGAPVITSLSPAHGPTAGGNQVTVNGSGFGPSSSVTFDGVAALIVSVSQSAIVAIAPSGAGTAAVVVTVPGGTSDGVTYTYDAPTISSISPDGGPADGGNQVVIAGRNFGTSPTVTFGTATATVVSSTQTSITVTAPAGVGGVPVAVSVAGQTSNAVTYTYDAPAITSISPDGGPTVGSNLVVIAGSNFGTSPSVTFGTATAPIVSSTQTSIKVAAPAGAGAVLVVVTAGGQSSNSVSYTYASPPSVASIVPDHGPTVGGNLVVIDGSGFGAAPTVTFDGTGATVVSSTDTSITVTAPAGQGAVIVVVTAGSQISGGLTYTYDPPTLAGIAPAAGLTTGGGQVVLTGTNFGLTPIVMFGALTAPVLTATQSSITVTAPAGSGRVPVVVTIAGQTSNSLTYTYQTPEPPAFTSAAATTFTIDSSGTFTIRASGPPDPSIVETGALPGGVTFTDNGDGTATLAGAPATGTAGSYPVTLTADNGVAPAASQAFTLNVALPPQVLTFSGIPAAAAYGDGPFGVAATSSAGLTPVSLVASGACSGGGEDSIPVTLLSAGTCTVTAAQGGDSAHAPGTATATFTVSPAATSTSLTATANPAPQGQPLTFVATVSPLSGGGTVSFSVYGGPICAGVPVGASGQAACTTSSLPAGTASVVALYSGDEDYAGSSSPSLSETVIATPNLPPAPTGVTAAAGDGSATVSWQPPLSGGVTGYVVTSLPGNFTVTTSVYQATITGLTNGTQYTFDVAAVNGAGTGPTAASGPVTPTGVGIPGAPTDVAATAGAGAATITWQPPVTGSAATSYTVSSAPGNFTVTTSVYQATISGLTDGTTYTFAVVASNGAGTGPAAQTNGVTPGAAPAPTVTDISPVVGPAAGATAVQITGSGFTGAVAVDFGAARATGFTVAGDEEITATAPAGTGTVDVTVTVPCGVAACGTSAANPGDRFTYLPLPAIAAISPTHGQAGTQVTLTGTGLQTVASVSFGGTPGSVLSVSPDGTQMTATAPAASGTVDVTVTTTCTDAAATSCGTSEPAAFTYGAGLAPVIRTLQPGWNTLSVPFPLADTDLADIIADSQHTLLAAYAYTDGRWLEIGPQRGGRWRLDELQAMSGLFVYVNATTTATLTPAASSGPPAPGATLPLQQGWNLVGPSTSAAQEPVSDLLAGVQSVAWFSDPNGTPYSVANPGADSSDQVRSGYAYWLYLTQGGQSLAGQPLQGANP